MKTEVERFYMEHEGREFTVLVEKMHSKDGLDVIIINSENLPDGIDMEELKRVIKRHVMENTLLA